MRGIAIHGRKVRQTRRALGWSQEQLAASAECDVKTVRNAEQSRRVDSSTLHRLAKSLGVDFVDLLPAYATDSLDGTPPDPVINSNLQTVLAWQTAFESRSVAQVLSFYAAEASVTVQSAQELPGGGEFRGRAAIHQWLYVTFSSYETEPIAPDMFEINGSGDYVFMRSKRDVKVTSRLTGQSVKASALHEFLLADAKIMHHRIFTDTLALSTIHESPE